MSVDVTARLRALAPAAGGAGGARRAQRSQAAVAFDLEALELLHSLVEMEAMLREVRPRYLRPRTFIRSKGDVMSERDKDELDADLVELVKNCSDKIDALRDATDAAQLQPSRIEHQREVVTYLLERLKNVANETKRMQRQRYNQPFLLSSRLLPEQERESLEAIEEKVKREATAAAQRAARASSISEKPSPPPPAETSKAISPSTAKGEASTSVSKAVVSSSATKLSTPSRKVPPKKPIALPFELASQNEELEFTEDEDRRFKAENVMLHRHFQQNLEDAKQMESKMAAISNLMGQFADKIMEQQTDIELIHQHAQETKTNVSQSNRILEQTEKIGRGYGFMIFCFYLGFSVLLHLLHFFHD